MSSPARATLPETDDDDAFGSHEHSDSTAADQTALEMPAHGDDADPTSIGYVDESDLGASSSFGSGFGDKTETWTAPPDDFASPSFAPSGTDDMDDDGGFGDKTENWAASPEESAPRLLGTFGADDMDDGGFGGKTENWEGLPGGGEVTEDGDDRTMSGVTLEPLPQSSGSDFAVASSLFPEVPKPLAREPRRASADRPALGERSTSRPGVPARADDVTASTARALRIPSKPAVDRVRRAPPPVVAPRPAPSPPASEDLEADVVQDAVGRSRATLVGLALASVLVLFVAGFFLSRFLAK